MFWLFGAFVCFHFSVRSIVFPIHQWAVLRLKSREDIDKLSRRVNYIESSIKWSSCCVNLGGTLSEVTQNSWWQQQEQEPRERKRMNDNMSCFVRISSIGRCRTAILHKQLDWLLCQTWVSSIGVRSRSARFQCNAWNDVRYIPHKQHAQNPP